MKIRRSDRVFAGLMGLLLLVFAALVVAEAFFAVPVTAALTSLLASRTLKCVLAVVAALLLALVLAGLSFALAFRRERKATFVHQQAEGGQMSVSMKAIESLVRKCVATRHEVEPAVIALQGTRDGLLIEIELDMSSDVSMPLVTNALQKQVKQYITACTGVDVKEVRVQVNCVSDHTTASAFSLPEAIAISNAAVQTDDRAIHQRLFGVEDKPVDLPKPLEQSETALAEEAAEEPKPVTDEAADARKCDDEQPATPAPAAQAQTGIPDELVLDVPEEEEAQESAAQEEQPTVAAQG